MKKVLIIEDDLIVANVYRNKLMVDGFAVETANSGEMGYDSLKKFKPDVVVLDLVLPNMSGIELIKLIRTEPGFEKLPIVVFSNTYLSNLVQDAWKAGATKCLSKSSCSPKQVVETLRSVLNLQPASLATSFISAEPRAKLSSPEKDPNATAQAELRRSFAATFTDAINALRNGIKALNKPGTEADRLSHTQEMYRRVRALTNAAAVASLTELAQLSEALEALTLELHDKPASINASTLRTVAAAIDFLPVLVDAASAPKTPTNAANANILVVDDEAISRRAVTHALERAKLKSVGVDDPNVALKMLTESSYDLVFLDVDMPGMNGHELCTKLRALPRHKKTPVVFVTGLTDFQNRANSMMSGGNDFIAKPFPFLELAVKSLVYVLRGKYPTPTAKPALAPA